MLPLSTRVGQRVGTYKYELDGGLNMQGMYKVLQKRIFIALACHQIHCGPLTLWSPYTLCKHQMHAKSAQGQAHVAIPSEGVVAQELELVISITSDRVCSIVSLEGSLIKLQGITLIM